MYPCHLKRKDTRATPSKSAPEQIGILLGATLHQKCGLVLCTPVNRVWGYFHLRGSPGASFFWLSSCFDRSVS